MLKHQLYDFKPRRMWIDNFSKKPRFWLWLLIITAILAYLAIKAGDQSEKNWCNSLHYPDIYAYCKKYANN